MRNAYLMLAGLCIAVLTGCAGAPPLQKQRPQAASSQTLGLAKSESVLQTNHLIQHLDEEKSIVYFQNQGGGGLGLGLLLGPIGVAANAAMIEGVTKADVERLKGKLRVDPVTLFREAAKQANIQVATQAGSIEARVTPHLRVSKTDESTIHLASALVVEFGAGPQQWTGRYSYQLPGSHTLASLAELDEAATAQLRTGIQAGFLQLLQFIAHENEAAITKEKPVHFKSAFLTPRFEFEQIGSLISDDGSIVWLRGVGGVFAVQKAQVSYTVQRN